MCACLNECIILPLCQLPFCAHVVVSTHTYTSVFPKCFYFKIEKSLCNHHVTLNLTPSSQKNQVIWVWVESLALVHSIEPTTPSDQFKILSSSSLSTDMTVALLLLPWLYLYVAFSLPANQRKTRSNFYLCPYTMKTVSQA